MLHSVVTGILTRMLENETAHFLCGAAFKTYMQKSRGMKTGENVHGGSHRGEASPGSSDIALDHHLC